MPISRIARTHLLYQFIILTLLFLGIGYYELLLQNKYILFLALMPMFFYQLVILSCCTELIPIPQWMNPNDIKEDTSESMSENRTELTQCPSKQDNPDASSHFSRSTLSPSAEKQPDGSSRIRSTLSPSAESQGTRQRTYKFRNWKKNHSDLNNTEHTSPSIAFEPSLTSPAEKFEFTIASEEDGFQRSDLTKRYFFPYRQKRLEQWVTSKENARPYKIRNRESNMREQYDSQLTDREDESCKNSIEMSGSDCSNVNNEPKFMKSYSFPFRQKRIEPYVESDILEETVETPSMPYWKTIEYVTSAKSEARKCRRAISTINLTSEQMDLINKENDDKQREFSQSVEISNPFDQLCSDSKKSSTKVSGVNFNKIKLGIVNCFSKMKKDNLKTSSDKKAPENKLRSFKNIFQSRENLFSPRLEECSDRKVKGGKEEEHCNFYPERISFEKYNFDK